MDTYLAESLYIYPNEAQNKCVVFFWHIQKTSDKQLLHFWLNVINKYFLENTFFFCSVKTKEAYGVHIQQHGDDAQLIQYVRF